MPFNTKSALGATRPLEIEYGGQTLRGQILASRLTPSAVARASREATAKERAADRERDHLSRALIDAETASVKARLAAAGVLPEIDGKVAEGHVQEAQADPDALARDVERTQEAVYAVEDALAAFDEEALEKKIVYLSGEIAQSLESWDAEYEDGSPVPLERDAIAGALPWQCVHQINEAIAEATAPSKKASTPSTSG